MNRHVTQYVKLKQHGMHCAARAKLAQIEQDILKERRKVKQALLYLAVIYLCTTKH